MLADIAPDTPNTCPNPHAMDARLTGLKMLSFLGVDVTES
jgi:hypothetical protein